MATGLENLKIYQMAEALELKVFHLTKNFPKDEKYRSVDQLRRSSSSITNNIAESYNKRSIKEKMRFLHDIAKSETEETKRNLIICHKKGFHHNKEIMDEYTELIMAISGYIRFLKNQCNNLSTYQLKNLKTNIKAFTLIELVLAIAILGILGGITFNIYSNFQLDVKIDEEANRIKYVLRQAQSKAINGENSASWGVRFVYPAVGDGYYDFFWGNSYLTGTTTDRYFLPTGVIFTNPPSGSDLDIIFNKRTGESASSSAITVSIKTAVSEITKNISVSIKGLIE